MSGAPDRAPDHNSWYNHALTVTWTGNDGSGSGIGTCSAASTYSGPDSPAAGVSGGCTDKAGNIGTGGFAFRYDATPPVITFTGNAGSYTVDQTVDIACAATDPTSGMDTGNTNCPNTNAAAYTFPLGANTINARAVDQAGNTSAASATFTVMATYNSMETTVSTFLASDPGVATSLNRVLRAARDAEARGNTSAEQGQIRAFINKVEAQRGKKLTGEQADALIRFARAL